MMESNRDPADAPVPSERSPGMPRWVKISLIVALVLLALFVIINLAGGGGEHGPGRHSGSAPSPALVADS